MFSCLYQHLLRHLPQTLHNPKPKSSTILPSTCPNHLNLPLLTTNATPSISKRFHSCSILTLFSTALHTSISSSSSLFSSTFACAQPSLPTSHCRAPRRPALCTCEG